MGQIYRYMKVRKNVCILYLVKKSYKCEEKNCATICQVSKMYAVYDSFFLIWTKRLCQWQPILSPGIWTAHFLKGNEFSFKYICMDICWHFSMFTIWRGVWLITTFRSPTVVLSYQRWDSDIKHYFKF